MLNSSTVNLKQNGLVQSFSNFIKTISSRTQVSEEQVIIKAFEDFQDKHPKWAESCFDIYFLTHTGKDAVASQDAQALSNAYLSQLTTIKKAKYQEKMEVVNVIAEDFLTLLAAQSKQIKGQQ